MQKFNLEWGWNHEDLAGNPIHLLLVGFTIALLILLRRKFKTKEVWPYLGIILLSYLFLGIIVRYDLYGNRYQLPFFLAFAPLVGITFETTSRHKIVLLLSFLLLLSAFPWVLFNRTRPLIAMRESNDPYTIPCLAGCTAGSILNEPPEKIMFAVWGSLGSSYVDAMKQVEATGCRDIGLKLDSSDLEYAYWWLLGAPQNGIRLESIVTYPELERYLAPNFKPCVVICTTCGKDMVTLNGLDLIGEFKPIKIYADKSHTPK
jgi:hypothetical protein